MRRTGTSAPGAGAAPSTPAPVRPRSRGRLVLSVFAILACAGIALVTVIDPYAGATAAPFYQQPVLGKQTGVQRFDVAGGYVLVEVSRDGFKATRAVVVERHVDADSGSGSDSGGGYTTPAGVAQTYAAEQVAKRGWAASEFSCLVNLWNRESGWNTHAENPSGAYGIPQALPGSKMATAGSGWQDSYQTQIDWGLGYIAGSYGSPCGAWGHSNAYGWY